MTEKEKELVMTIAKELFLKMIDNSSNVGKDFDKLAKSICTTYNTLPDREVESVASPALTQN